MNDAIKRATGLLIIEVRNSNPNGDPDRESDPRQRPDMRGEISGVSFKRKLRDLVEDKEGPVWKALKDKLSLGEEKFFILESRGRDRNTIVDEMRREKKENKIGRRDGPFSGKYWDARIFGNTFLEKAGEGTPKKENPGKEFIKTGVVQFGLGLSVAPVTIERHTNTVKAGVQEGKTAGMAPMGYRFVPHGAYCMPFFVNPTMAVKSGCDVADIGLLKALIPYAYAHTRSRSRPFVEIRHAWYCEHENPIGSAPDHEIIDALTPKKRKDPDKPSGSWTDYVVPDSLPKEVLEKYRGIGCVDLLTTMG